MNRTKAILAAASFTGLLLITILALGSGGLKAKSDADLPEVPTSEAALLQTNGSPSEETLQAWQEYSAQLEQTVRILQQRDAAYQQQLETANSTILQLQQQINNISAPRFFEEHEEDEHRENDAFEFGEFDD